MDWHPMETAPKDGTYIVLREPRSMPGASIGRWLAFDEVIFGETGFWEANWDNVHPTGWMPLPELSTLQKERL